MLINHLANMDLMISIMSAATVPSSDSVFKIQGSIHAIHGEKAEWTSQTGLSMSAVLFSSLK